MDAVTVATTRAAFREAAADAAPGTRIPVVGTVSADPWTAYRRARGPGPGFFFETSGGHEGWGYFGVDPVDFVSVTGGDTLAHIEHLLEDESLHRGDCEVPYPGGLFGWLSYDIVRELEDLPDGTVDDRHLPTLQLGVYDTIVAWEAPLAEDPSLRIIATPKVGNGDTEMEAIDGVNEQAIDGVSDHAIDEVYAQAIDDVYEQAIEDIESLATRALEGDPTVGPPPMNVQTAEFESQTDRESYAERVATVKQYIRDGDTFQANISQRLEAPAAVHPVEVFAALRAVNPAPYSGLVEFPGVDLVSASPELLLERDGDRLLTEPIAGTRPRGANEDEDEALEADLTGDEKERAEHAMLVDLERNDLGKVSEYGTVTVDEYRRVDRYSEVMHLVSLVSGTLREDATLADSIRAVFPGGTITGAPKPRTMEIIDEVESTRRGPYTGSMAAIGFDGRATLNIIIRTLVRAGEEYHLRVGGGIVHDSVPDSEYEETLDKARALVNAVDVALADSGAMEVRE